MLEMVQYVEIDSGCPFFLSFCLGLPAKSTVSNSNELAHE